MADPPRPVLLDGRGFLEGPRWHDDELWLSDLHRHEVLAVSTDGTSRVVAQLDDQPSGLGFLPDGTALVVSLLDRRVLRLPGLAVHADLRALTVGGTNDMIVDAQGRAYVGSFGYDVFGRAPRAPGNLVLIAPDGSTGVVAADLQFPNGMAISEEGTLLVAESAASRITEFDVGDDGTLSGRRVWSELPGGPDGVAIDAEGALWVSLPRQGRFVRVRRGGECVGTLPARPGWRAVACALGGPDGRTLFMAMALVEGSAATAALEAVVVDVPAPKVVKA
jgi:sugar lactone lactonase YvrE